jgi:hypothetical protein
MGKAKAWLDANGTDLHRYGEQEDDDKKPMPARLRANGVHTGA